MNPPFVSCLMPTADRRRFVPQAIAYFLQQDYPDRELIILDDGREPVADLVPDDGRIRYERLPRKMVLGAKRNLACQQARGEFLVHWDDDDWFAPWRVRYQVEQLQQSGADLCGLAKMWFFDPQHQRAWEYVYGNPRKPWAAGGSLCYRRAFWERNRFPEINVGEDSRFVWARPGARLHLLPDNTFYAALVHPANTSPKRVSDARYQRRAYSDFAARLGDSLAFYEGRENVTQTATIPAAAVAPSQPAPPPVFSLCYTSRRPHLIASVVRLWRERAGRPDQLEFIIAVDGDDPAGQAAARGVADATVVVQDTPPFNCVRGWNAAAALARGQVLVAASDDIEPPVGWDRALHELPPAGWMERDAVVVTSDKLFGTACHLPIVTRTRLQRLGYLLCPEYESMYSDTDLAAHARHDGVLIDASAQLAFPHRHPDKGGRARDAVDVRQAAPERYRRGAEIFRRRQHEGFRSAPAVAIAGKLEAGLPVPRDIISPTPSTICGADSPASNQAATNERYAAHIQTVRDDFCLGEVLERLADEGVRDFFVCVPDQHWSGVTTTAEESAQVAAALARLEGRPGVSVEIVPIAVAPHRAHRRPWAQVETGVRNAALDHIRRAGFRHCLVVDDDELWRRGTLMRLDALIRARRPECVTCRMIPVVGVPGFPVGDNKDLVTIYLDLARVRFRECRSPQGTPVLLDWPGVIHFTAVKRTREELAAKMRESGHYDDPTYDFEGWIRNTMPNLRPGFRNAHMYRRYQIWPVVRDWQPDEIAELPPSLAPHLGVPQASIVP